MVAPAEVLIDGGRKTAGGGGTGTNIDGPGRCWHSGAYTVCCDFGPPPAGLVCEIALATGGPGSTTDKKSNPERLPSLTLIENRWGWAINLASPGATTDDAWAGAGLNRKANRAKVGTWTVA